MVLQKISSRKYSKDLQGRIAVVVADFHQEIVEGLLRGAQEVFNQYPGIKHLVYRVPGAFEVPLAAQKIARDEAADVILTLGCIVKGDTYHFELVANECARGCMQVMLEESIPVVFEVLAVYDYKDALKRCEGDANHGVYAAQVALEWLSRKNEEARK